jgi:hypothetical protein
MGNQTENGEFYIYFEGGIATNTYVLPRLREIITALVSNKSLYEKMNKTPPILPIMDKEPAPVLPGSSGVTADQLAQADLSIMGAGAMAIAQDMMS